MVPANLNAKLDTGPGTGFRLRVLGCVGFRGYRDGDPAAQNLNAKLDTGPGTARREHDPWA